MNLRQRLEHDHLVAPFPVEKVTWHYTDTLADLFPEMLEKDVHVHDWRVHQIFDPTIPDSKYLVKCTWCGEEHTRTISYFDVIR